MKNSRNKIIAAAFCGLITGSIGTSLIGNFQANQEVATNLNNNKDNSDIVNNDDSSSNNSSNIPQKGQYGTGKGQGGRGDHHKGEASLDSTEGIDINNGQYTDGTYEGSASGFSSGLKVQVKIENGEISDVQVVSHNETPGFCERAIETVPAEIISEQSTNVDTVSGATYTSVGIINAVNDALSNAQSSSSNNTTSSSDNL